MDELHVFFDRERRPWGVLQDSDGDNVAITNDGGDVVAEFVYDPYGAVIGQRSYGVHPPLKSGHRGLFAESLTVGTVGTPDADLGDPIETAAAWVDGRVLVPNERVVYHMRNRAYDPGPSGATAGRFIQRDPNASGAVLYGGGGGLGSHGEAPLAIVTGLDLAGHVGDGVNTYGYLRGRMRDRSDPAGLVTVAEVAGHAATVVVAGLRGGVEGITGGYGTRMLGDVEWAMDWSAGDDDHSRGSSLWVADSFELGMRDGFRQGLAMVLDDLSFGLWPDSGEPAYAAAGGGAARSAGKAVHAAAKMHRHHLVPQFVSRLLSNQITTKLLNVPSSIHYQYHAHINRAMRDKLGLSWPISTAKLNSYINQGATAADRLHNKRYIMATIRASTRDFMPGTQWNKEFRAGLDDAIRELWGQP